MQLPVLNQLRTNQSTYITFTKALTDFDKAVNTSKPYYFTKMVALNLPQWQSPNFFIDLSTIGVTGSNPNILIPKTIQYYMENICRQVIGNNNTIIEEITEIAFWKMLNIMGLTVTQYKDCVTFINSISVSNFIKSENNNGWGEIVCQIPNKCTQLTPAFKILDNVANVVQCNDVDTCLYDNGNNQFEFGNFKNVIDFENCTFDEVTQGSFDFNTLLLFYTDETGINKLHGINFIYPFTNMGTYWNTTIFTQLTNIVQTLGYQFKFNIKTCNNDASQLLVYEQQDQSFYNNFGETLGKLNSFLEIKMRENATS